MIYLVKICSRCRNLIVLDGWQMSQIIIEWLFQNFYCLIRYLKAKKTHSLIRRNPISVLVYLMIKVSFTAFLKQTNNTHSPHVKRHIHPPSHVFFRITDIFICSHYDYFDWFYDMSTLVEISMGFLMGIEIKNH